MTLSLASLYRAVANDPGLRALIPDAQIDRGLAAAADLNRVLLRIITQTGVNADGLISPSDMQRISDTLWRDENAALWRDFWVAHGNDSGTVTSGFHWVQNDGASMLFQGRNFVDTVADGIYHYGFRIEGGRYANEDGNNNERIADVAGWLNFFLNGRTVVFGSAASETLYSGEYSAYFAAAAHETFRAGAGNDSIWADVGNDVVLAGEGHDESGGGLGNDRLWGEAGNDSLWGDAGADRLMGGDGDDRLGGGIGNDTANGGAGADHIWGDAGRDILAGGLGNDVISGGDGADRLLGGGGNDRLNGDEGADHIAGGSGADRISLWESLNSRDVLYFRRGDSGMTEATIDRIEGFQSGVDQINLSSFGPMQLAPLEFLGRGRASVRYDGEYLRIDANGDAAADMIVAFDYVESLTARDFIFG